MLRPEGVAQWLPASWILQLQGTKQHAVSETLMTQNFAACCQWADTALPLQHTVSDCVGNFNQ